MEISLFKQYNYTKRFFMAIFILSFILGAALKIAVADTLTMGFEDYKLAPQGTLYNVNSLQKAFISKSRDELNQ